MQRVHNEFSSVAALTKAPLNRIKIHRWTDPIPMLFRKRKSLPPEARTDSDLPQADPIGYLIEFDMMLKGTIHKRGSSPVRQYGVTVRGSTRLVTSGDWVDRETYEALVEAGAVRPDPQVLQRIAERKKRILTDAELEAGQGDVAS